jgi:diguanylate cyclase (GGDEF)-like protein/PAS domain S-box-containing protein
MRWIVTPGAVALLVAAVIMLVALAMVWPRRRAVGGGPLTGLLTAMLVWTVLTGLEQAVVGVNAKVTLSAFSYIGSVAVPVFFFLFCVEYTQSDTWLPRPRWLIWVVPVGSVLAAFTNGMHHQLWPGFEAESGNTLHYLHGPLFWVMIAYSYVLVIASMLVIVLAIGRHDRGYRGQFIAVLLFATFPVLASVGYVLELTPIPGLDPTPIAFSLTAVGLAWSLLRQGLLTVVPIAQATVLQNLQDAVVVIDSGDRVALVNHAFKNWFGVHGSVIGQDVATLLSAWPQVQQALGNEEEDQQVRLDYPERRFLDISRGEVRDERGRVRGWVVVLRDVTALRLTERQLREANIRLTTQLQTIQTLQEGLKEQALRDSLTGLYNRRYLEETVGRELARAGRDGQHLSLLMIDLDHFKTVNDEFGHAAGDRVLRWFGDLVRTKLRPGDIACRYGGEEFVLIMPTASRETALERADEIRLAFRQLVGIASDHQYGDVTLSAGVAVFPDDATAAGELRRKADAALYTAKRAGRDRVVGYTDESVTSWT